MLSEASAILYIGGTWLGPDPSLGTTPPTEQTPRGADTPLSLGADTPWKEHGARHEVTSYTPWKEHGTRQEVTSYPQY